MKTNDKTMAGADEDNAVNPAIPEVVTDAEAGSSGNTLYLLNLQSGNVLGIQNTNDAMEADAPSTDLTLCLTNLSAVGNNNIGDGQSYRNTHAQPMTRDDPNWNKEFDEETVRNYLRREFEEAEIYMSKFLDLTIHHIILLCIRRLRLFKYLETRSGPAALAYFGTHIQTGFRMLLDVDQNLLPYASKEYIEREIRYCDNLVSQFRRGGQPTLLRWQHHPYSTAETVSRFIADYLRVYFPERVGYHPVLGGFWRLACHLPMSPRSHRAYRCMVCSLSEYKNQGIGAIQGHLVSCALATAPRLLEIVQEIRQGRGRLQAAARTTEAGLPAPTMEVPGRSVQHRVLQVPASTREVTGASGQQQVPIANLYTVEQWLQKLIRGLQRGKGMVERLPLPHRTDFEEVFDTCETFANCASQASSAITLQNQDNSPQSRSKKRKASTQPASDNSPQSRSKKRTALAQPSSGLRLTQGQLIEALATTNAAAAAAAMSDTPAAPAPQNAEDDDPDLV